MHLKTKCFSILSNMSKFDCGCRVMTDETDLNNKKNKLYWGYLFETFVNLCGNCSKAQRKSQLMENKMTEMQKERLDLFKHHSGLNNDAYDPEPEHKSVDREIRDPGQEAWENSCEFKMAMWIHANHSD